MDDEEIIFNESLSGSSTTDVEEVASTSYSKQRKQIGNRRKNKFKDSWKNNFNWLARANEETMAKCFVCGVGFSIQTIISKYENTADMTNMRGL